MRPATCRCCVRRQQTIFEKASDICGFTIPVRHRFANLLMCSFLMSVRRLALAKHLFRRIPKCWSHDGIFQHPHLRTPMDSQTAYITHLGHNPKRIKLEANCTHWWGTLPEKVAHGEERTYLIFNNVRYVALFKTMIKQMLHFRREQQHFLAASERLASHRL